MNSINNQSFMHFSIIFFKSKINFFLLLRKNLVIVKKITFKLLRKLLRKYLN